VGLSQGASTAAAEVSTVAAEAGDKRHEVINP
jgi:hypothetical protein